MPELSELPELPPLIFAPLGARSAAYFTDTENQYALENLITSTEQKKKLKRELRELREKTRVIASDEPDWWHASVSHSRPTKSVSMRVGAVVFACIFIESVVLIPLSHSHKDCDLRCNWPAATLATPFAFLTLPIGVLDALISIKAAIAVRARVRANTWDWNLFFWHLFAPLSYPWNSNYEGNELHNEGDEKVAEGVINKMKKAKIPELNENLQKKIRQELREAQRIEEAWSIFWLSLLGHIFLLVLCILLYTPGCTSWRIQILTTATLLAISVGLMWFDRWRYKITPLQMLFLIALLLPSGILLAEEFEHVEWLPFAPLRELCTATTT